MPLYMSPQRAQQTNSTQRAGESLPIADASSNIASHLILIKNTSGVASNIAIEREKSADIIKRFLQKSIAAQSYGEMFSNGFYFKRTGNDLPKQEGRFSFSTLDHLNKISSENLADITKKLSPLTLSERELLSKVMSTKIHFRHQSNADLGGATLNIFSNKKLAENQIVSNSNTRQNDRACLSNHDFVFFGIEFSGNKEVLPLNTIRHTVDFGANAYILDEKYEHGYFTLTDHFDNIMPPAFLHEHRDFIAQFPRARDEVHRIVHGGKGKHDVPIYNTTNMRQALGMHLIDFIRSSEDQALKKFVFDDTLDESKLDKVINFVFQPEFHVPRMVSTTDHQEVSLRKMSLEDAVKACNTKELSLLIMDKKDACEAMEVAVRKSKDEVVAYLFDRWEFTENDTKYISDSFYDLEYTLSKHGASTAILKEFLQRGLVSVNTPFKYVNRGRTMLDNAMKWSNNDEMISILKEYGAVGGVELL